MNLKIILILSIFGCLSTNCKSDEDKIKNVVLTWQNDPTTTMTVDWHTLNNEVIETIKYKRVGDGEWLTKTGITHEFPFSERTISRVELENLDSGTKYEFKFDDNSEIYWFKTMPENTVEEITFIESGDVGVGEAAFRVANLAATYNPDFIVLGGDLSYANGSPARVETWYKFLDMFQDSFKGKDNRIIPMVVALGNHETWGEHNGPDHLPLDQYRLQYDLLPGEAPYFEALFAFPGSPEYGVLDFGDYLSLIILDSGHKNDIEGAQTEWLKQTLEERVDKPIKFAVYHVPAYPSFRPINGITSQKIRQNWVPLFEDYKLSVAFEHHDHTYKRTYPLKRGEINQEDGLVFIGDGAWGIQTRDFEEEPRWYMEKVVSQRHFILGKIKNDTFSLKVINEDNELIDMYPYDSSLEHDLVYKNERMVRKKITNNLIKANESDSLALVSFFKSTNGKNWNTNSNWLSGPVQSWYGITMRGDRVSRIYLQENNLSGELPKELSELAGIERLYISGNPDLKGEIPIGFTNLKKLQRIRMSGNGLTGSLPLDIGRLENLTTLLFAGNNFNGQLPESIGELRKVDSINLSNNNFEGSIPMELGKLNLRLHYLNLSNNKLSGTIPSELGNIRYLKTLDLSGNNFDGDAPKKIYELQSIYLETLLID